ncbi:MAG: RNA polymerase sigma factor [Vicinamibacterales bacterium]
MYDLEGVTDRAAAAHRRYYASVYRYVRRRTRNREDAEDLTQTVFTEAVTGLEQAAAESGSVVAWLYTVAKRRLIDEQRRRQRTPAHVISLDAARLVQQSQSDYGVDVARTLARAIAALPAEQRLVVVLKLVEGRRFAEIAAELGITEQACRARLSRALRTLRTHLEKEGMAP